MTCDPIRGFGGREVASGIGNIPAPLSQRDGAFTELGIDKGGLDWGNAE